MRRSGLAGAQRQDGLAAVQRLHLALFIDTQHHPARVCADGFSYSPTLARTFATKNALVERGQFSCKWGLRPKARQMRTMAWASGRVLQCVACAGLVSSVRVMTASTFASVSLRGWPERGASPSAPSLAAQKALSPLTHRRLAGDERLLWAAVGRQRAAGQLPVRVGPARRTTRAAGHTVDSLSPSDPGRAHPPSQSASPDLVDDPSAGTAATQRFQPDPVAAVDDSAGDPCGGSVRASRRVCAALEIEVIHKVLKSGCQIEQRQWETAARWERVLAVDQVVAWRWLALCKTAREQPDEAVSAGLGRAEWEAL